MLILSTKIIYQIFKGNVDYTKALFLSCFSMQDKSNKNEGLIAMRKQ